MSTGDRTILGSISRRGNRSSLDGPCARRALHLQAGTKERRQARTKEQYEARRLSMT
jgi:hypothetical protein